jgi:UPF0716 protein FxsA
VILLLALAYIVLEVVAAVVLASFVGWVWVFVVVLALFALGCALMRRAGMSAARSLRATTTPQGLPGPGAGRAVGDASLQFVAAALIAVPGLISSLFGLSLLITPLRRVAGAGLVLWFAARVRRSGMTMMSTYDADGAKFTRIVPGDVVEGEVVPNPDPEHPDQDPPALRL